MLSKIYLGPAPQLKTKMINLNKILMPGMIKDFVILWNAPIDNPAIKSIKEESRKTGFEKDFTSFIFGNMILGRKS